MFQIDPQDTATIANQLRQGSVIALPTETVFGLAVSLDSTAGIARLAQLKQRDYHSGKVFTLVPQSSADISQYALIPPLAEPLIQQYVPGALTLILPKNPHFHHPYYDHFSTVGLRIPDFSLFQRLLPLSGPLLLTSANLRGEAPCRTPQQVIRQLPVDGVVMGAAGNTAPSTIVKVDEAVQVIRKGDIIIR